MKKLLLVIIMLAICAAFFTMATNRRPWLKPQNQKPDIYTELQKDNEQIEENYPADPKALVELNNKIMSYLYSKHMVGDNLIDLYADTIRKFYSEELLLFTPKEDQIKNILEEKENYINKNIKLLKSEIKEVVYLDNNSKARVKVIYYISVGDITRNYNLENTKEGWKITSWQDSKLESRQLEEK